MHNSHLSIIVMIKILIKSSKYLTQKFFHCFFFNLHVFKNLYNLIFRSTEKMMCLKKINAFVTFVENDRNDISFQQIRFLRLEIYKKKEKPLYCFIQSTIYTYRYTWDRRSFLNRISSRRKEHTLIISRLHALDIYLPSDEIRKKKIERVDLFIEPSIYVQLKSRVNRINDKRQIWTRVDNVNATTARKISLHVSTEEFV